jgi:hypothetical protein
MRYREFAPRRPRPDTVTEASTADAARAATDKRIKARKKLGDAQRQRSDAARQYAERLRAANEKQRSAQDALSESPSLMNMAATVRTVVGLGMQSNVPDLQTTLAFGPKWKRAFFDLFARQRYTHAITLVWNGKVSRAKMRDDLKRFHLWVDKELLGSRCHLYPAEKRSHAVFVIESGVNGDHSHCHSYWRFPPGKLIPFNKLFPGERGGLWSKLIRRGTYKVAMVSPHCRNDEFSGYLLKKQHPGSEGDDIIWSDDFLPDR